MEAILRRFEVGYWKARVGDSQSSYPTDGRSVHKALVGRKGRKENYV